MEEINQNNMKKFLAQKETLVIDDSEKYVTNFAYSEYTSLRELTLGKSVTEIKNGAFYGCENLETIHLGQNKNFSFKDGCLIQKRTKRLSLSVAPPFIPDNVKKVNMTCFLKSQPVTEFYIGAALEDIDRASRKFPIEKIVLSPDNQTYELREGCLFKKGGSELILGCDSGTIPEGTEIVDTWAFSGCRIKKIEIPASVQRIEFAAFEDCTELEEVIFKEGNLKRIESYAFNNCTSLKTVELPKSLAFYYADSFCRGVRKTQRK